MRIEDRACSFELSYHLKELDVKQVSLFYWEKQYSPHIITDWRLSIGYQYNEHISAFTAEEIGQLLPDLFRKDKEWHLLTINKLNGNWGVSYATVNSITLFNSVEDKILANAMAKMLVYLIENGFLEFENEDDEVTKNER